MDGRKSVIHNESMSPRSLITDMSSPVTTNTHVLPRHRKRKPNIAIPPPLNLESIEEERGLSDYDCGYLDLGAETPSTPIFMQNQAPLHIPRRRSFRRASPVPTNRLNKYADAVDRDCGIWYATCAMCYAIFRFECWTSIDYSFEYAVLPCRTLCCGKIFCTEHLADVRNLCWVYVLFLNLFNSGYMDLKQKVDVLIVKTLAHLQVVHFHLHRQLNVPDAISLLRLSILLLQLLSGHIRVTHWGVCETILKWHLHHRPRHLHIPPVSIIRRQRSPPKDRRQMISIIFTIHFQMKESLRDGEWQAALLAFCFFWCFCTSSGHENDSVHFIFSIPFSLYIIIRFCICR